MIYCKKCNAIHFAYSEEEIINTYYEYNVRGQIINADNVEPSIIKICDCGETDVKEISINLNSINNEELVSKVEEMRLIKPIDDGSIHLETLTPEQLITLKEYFIL